MEKKLILGGVLGGVALFAWLGFSWAVLPFHRDALRELPTSRPTALDVMGSASLPHGVYYSGMPHAGSRRPEVPFMVYLPQGYPSQAAVMLPGLLLSTFAALIVAFIVVSARQQSFKSRVGTSVLVGMVVALAGPLTFGNFFFLPFDFLWPEVADQLIGWTLAGLVIAAFTKPGSS